MSMSIVNGVRRNEHNIATTISGNAFLLKANDLFYVLNLLHNYEFDKKKKLDDPLLI